jgi:purine-binding chemotaxis protein CheW
MKKMEEADKQQPQSENFSQEAQQLVSFKIGSEEFGLNIKQVREIIRYRQATPVPRAPDFIEGVINLRGQVVAVVNLAKRLNLEAKPISDISRIIVVEIDDGTVGIIVDEANEVLRLPVNDIQETPDLIASKIEKKFIKGVGKLGERLIILMDLRQIFSAEEIEELEKTNKHSEPDSKEKQEK